MQELAVWKFLVERLFNRENVALLIVVASQGSSPGRLGFKMAVASDGAMTGSIGGGIMEHKLVEYAIDKLKKGKPFNEIKRQIHSKEAPNDQSGMICSGEQTIALLSVTIDNLRDLTTLIEVIENREKRLLMAGHSGLSFMPYSGAARGDALERTTERKWHYHEVLGKFDVAHVIGAGHVGLEMCNFLAGLGFFVINYDDRPNLNTMEANAFAHQKIVTPYPEIAKYIESGENVYVIVMTFGYRGDDEAVRALLGKKFKYFGMMGSEAKVAKLLGGLRKDGFAEADISAIRTPAGLVAHCKTPAEIAVSVAAEMIAARNQSL